MSSESASTERYDLDSIVCSDCQTLIGVRPSAGYVNLGRLVKGQILGKNHRVVDTVLRGCLVCGTTNPDVNVCRLKFLVVLGDQDERE